MKTLSILSSLALVSLIPGAALANPGLHAHPHLIASERPFVDLPPMASLAAILIVWTVIVIGVEAVARRRPTAV